MDILGGAVRVKCRPRGFVDWNPRAGSRALLDDVRGVLDEYADYLPLTCRQVFYRLVGAHGFAKTEKAYASLCEMLNRARRARMIPMGASRDDGGQRIDPPAWRDAEDLLLAFRYQAVQARSATRAGDTARADV